MNIREHELDIEHILSMGKQLIKEAGDNTLKYFPMYQGYQKTLLDKVSYKDDDSPVTEADKSTELLLCEKIKKYFPTYGIISEESEDYNPQARYKWIIDPIDGTRSFITGIPLYTILLGLFDSVENIPLIGYIYSPTSGECVYASIGQGAYFENLYTIEKNKHTSNTPLHCDTTVTSLSRSTLISHDFKDAIHENSNIYTIMMQSKLPRTWADGYAYLLLSCKRAHAIIDTNMHVWDILPIYPILHECGATISTFSGNEIQWSSLLNQENTSSKKNTVNIVCTSSRELSIEILGLLETTNISS